MPLSKEEQIKKILEDKKHILITFRKNGSKDAIASALALANFLKKYNKKVDIVSDGFVMNKSMEFLGASNTINPGFTSLQKFVISLDVKKTGIKELSYDLKDDSLRIFVTPKEGYLIKDSVRTAQTEFCYDLIFTLDTPDLESLGEIYKNNTELFYKVPTVNIDKIASNEHFGQINIVNSTYSAICEILLILFKKIGPEFIDKNIAKALLTGIISETRSFKANSVKPHTLSVAGELIKLGADREKIVQNLYRTKTLPMLKLWGSVLSNMQIRKDLGLVWSTITRETFARAEAEENDLNDIIDELINNSPETKLTLLLHEHDDEKTRDVHVVISSNKNHNVLELTKKYRPVGTNKDASFVLKKTNLVEAEKEILGHLEEQLAK